ncbi:TIGR03087 family PEP-CTERM/XrtA system glycosyltransferase [Pseudoduganella aquatica]|uniref:TIGR03087 family PEP-CTERM/XrtA system glycosyltransferase n=1 Tax=Pseudoduganella aquatica TaxID=2660641 RepID=A0A7X4HIC1_9BURK|nr:TIGR03087 family PEP-CTERM/XrtA system glycosyltransferase [Pseudoduganella aquatica]MYN10685.1 TIGR03087 family PEP-CTERM/XrtA system glycosyltransferase [Pseudoduganella aquatica]
MDNLLLLVHRIPYPPNKGDKIRSYHLLKHLAEHYRVHLATFVDDQDDWQHVPRLQAMTASAHFAPLNPKKARVRSLGALLGNRSLSLDYYRDAGLRRWVDETVRREGITRIVVFSSAMAQYAEAYPDATRVVDFVDVDSDKWRQYAEKKSWPMSMLYAHEARQLLAYERRVALECDAALFVSAPEAELFRTLAPESAARTGHFSNGVDTAYFSPEGPQGQPHDHPYTAQELPLVFTGAMDYWPNIDAVTWFARDVLPAVRARHPQAVFYIVGARPASEVQELAGLPGVVVTGTVPDVRPYVAHASLCVAPLRIARGIQNKVLEAMAMARTVVVSPQALEGIEAEPGRSLLLAADAPAFIATVNAALDQPDAAIGRAARATVEHLYGWNSHLAQVCALLEAGRPVRKEA